MGQKAIVLLAIALVTNSGALGCDEGGEFVSRDDAAADSDTDADSDADSEADYPTGPYGFTPAIVWDTTIGEWTDDGEIIPNICLDDANGDERCLADFWGSADSEIVFVDFMSMS